MPKKPSLGSLLKKYRFEIGVLCAVIFFIILFIFKDKINSYLEGKEDFKIPISSVPSDTIKENPAGVRPIKKKYENRCRDIFENLLKVKFPSVRPSFLTRSNGYALELDGFNDKLKLGFEYNGRQHYSHVKKFHKTIEDFYQQQVRDSHKEIMCKNAGVTVVVIPYTVKWDDLESYIRSQLKKLGYQV